MTPQINVVPREVASPVAQGGPVRRYRPPPRMGVLRPLLRNRGALIGGAVIVVEILAAVGAPLVARYDPIAVSPLHVLEPPGLVHPFGTDNLGRDMLSRVLFGARISLQLGIISVLVAATLGILVGLPAGYLGGALDVVLMRLMDALLAFPHILLALAIVAVLGPSMTNVMLAVGISAIPSYARVVRSSVLAIKQAAYVEAARALGCRDLLIMWRHVLPNALPPLIVLATLGVAAAIFAAASLSYLGVGAQPPTPEWGSMISRGRDQLRVAWWISTFPGLAIVVSVLSINMLGDGLRDVLDPRLHGQRT